MPTCNPMSAKCFKSTEIISPVKSRLIPNIKYNKLIFLFVLSKMRFQLLLHKQMATISYSFRSFDIKKNNHGVIFITNQYFLLF